MSKRLDRLIHVYDVAVRDEQRHYESYRSHVKFYGGILGATVAATGAILKTGSADYNPIVLLFSSMVFAGISTIGLLTADTGYRRWLEALTIRAKLEHLLGLDIPVPRLSPSTKFSWTGESVTPDRFLNDMAAFPSSAAFVNDRLGKGSNRLTRALFGLMALLGLVVAAVTSRWMLQI